MKLIVAGSRSLQLPEMFIGWAIMDLGIGGTEEIVTGKAKGVDFSGEMYGRRVGMKVKEMPANWNKFGKSAGHRRNAEMAEYADQLLLIWDGESAGSKGMKEQMIRLGKPVHEIIIKRTPCTKI